MIDHKINAGKLYGMIGNAPSIATEDDPEGATCHGKLSIRIQGADPGGVDRQVGEIHRSGERWVLENHSMEWGSGVTPGGNQYPNQIRNSPASTLPKAAVVP